MSLTLLNVHCVRVFDDTVPVLTDYAGYEVSRLLGIVKEDPQRCMCAS